MGRKRVSIVTKLGTRIQTKCLHGNGIYRYIYLESQADGVRKPIIFVIHKNRLRQKTEMDVERSHVNRIVESQDTVAFHYAVNTFGHPVCPFGSNAHGARSCQSVGSGRLSSFVGSIGYQDKTLLLYCFHKCRHNILQLKQNG